MNAYHLNNAPADTVYKMFAFQYGPLEKRIKAAILSRPGGEKAWKQYQALPAIKKIAILDRVAAQLGL
uniref:Uncharacterized protein n=1 Tax=viral metagenome TaxID=1070528 RepID=A0A6H1Z9N0_9ZZZZ